MRDITCHFQPRVNKHNNVLKIDKLLCSVNYKSIKVHKTISFGKVSWWILETLSPTIYTSLHTHTHAQKSCIYFLTYNHPSISNSIRYFHIQTTQLTQNCPSNTSGQSNVLEYGQTSTSATIPATTATAVNGSTREASSSSTLDRHVSRSRQVCSRFFVYHVIAQVIP